jgi:hypothetical protein
MAEVVPNKVQRQRVTVVLKFLSDGIWEITHVLVVGIIMHGVFTSPAANLCHVHEAHWTTPVAALGVTDSRLVAWQVIRRRASLPRVAVLRLRRIDRGSV